MMDLLVFIGFNILGVMSPGPDFAIVTRFGLVGSRKAALSATMGIAAALVIHVCYCVTGIAFLLNSSKFAFLLIKLLGGIYLTYLGYMILLGSSKEGGIEEKVDLRNAFTTGFFTNLLNPKATIFLLSLFGLFAEAMNTWSMKLAFGISIPLIALTWFSILSVFLTHPKFLPFFQKKRRIFLLCMGSIVVCLGVGGIGSAFFEYYELYCRAF